MRPSRHPTRHRPSGAGAIGEEQMRLRYLGAFFTMVILFTLFSTSFLWAQLDPFGEPAPARNQDPFGNAENSGKQATHRWRVGMSITADGGPCGNFKGTASVPQDWPEQQVRIVDEEITGNAKVAYRILPAGIKQMLVAMPRIFAGTTETAIVTFEVTRSHIAPPSDTTDLSIPRSMPSIVRLTLGSSSFIDTRDAGIRRKGNEIFKTASDANDWDKVKAIHEWVVANIQHQPNNNAIVGASKTLQTSAGGYEDLTNLFIALCRVNKIPARIVWCPDHCYAEFYLQNSEKKSKWYPCSLVGEKEFGFSTEERVILQKGDNIKVPEKNDPQRYVAEFVKASGKQGGKPRVNFVRQYLAAEK